MIRVPATNKTNQHSVIFLHGLGDSGQGWSFLATEAKNFTGKDLSNINFIFPTAPTRSVTINFGVRLNAWYDLKSLSDVYTNEDQENIMQSVNLVKTMILNEHKNFNIPLDKIIIGGFSQGCALSLLLVTLIDFKIGGIIGLGGYYPILNQISYLNDLRKINIDINKKTPIFIGHGTKDNAIKFEYSVKSSDFLKNSLGFENVTYNKYQGLSHSVSTEETADILSWLGDIAYTKSLS